MDNLDKKSIIVACLFGILLIAGCYEDTLDLTLNADGSGKVKQKLVFSERFLVAFEESESSTRGPVAEENKRHEQLGCRSYSMDHGLRRNRNFCSDL